MSSFRKAGIIDVDLSHDYHPTMSYHRRAGHKNWNRKTSQRRGSYFGTYSPKSERKKYGRKESITFETEKLFKSKNYFSREKQGIHGRDILMRGLRTPTETGRRNYSSFQRQNDDIVRRNQKSTLELLHELDDCERALKSMNDDDDDDDVDVNDNQSHFVKSVSNLLSELDEVDQTLHDLDTTFRYEDTSHIEKKNERKVLRKRPSLITHQDKAKQHLSIEIRDRIFLAIATGNLRDVKQLVEEYTARRVSNAKDETGHTALEFARSLGRIQILGYLLSELLGEYPEVELSTLTHHTFYFFFCTCVCVHSYAIPRYLRSCGVDVPSKCSRSELKNDRVD